MTKGPNTFGGLFRATTFGESHGPALGVVLDGVIPGLSFDMEKIQAELHRRRPGQSAHTTSRQEPDRVEVLSGVYEGRTTGAPICLVVRNVDARPGAYEKLKDRFRPGHADFTLWSKYGIRDPRGGGRASGRETLARVAAGALAKELLSSKGVLVLGFTRRVGDINASLEEFETLLKKGALEEARRRVEASPLRCPDPVASKQMEELISQVREEGDSVGAVVDVQALGVPAGWGDPTFWKLDAELAAAALSIGGVKGVGFGAGFAITKKRGSEANDALGPEGFLSNRAGGILGGVSNGAPVVVRVGVKPTSSISLPQDTIDMQGHPCKVEVGGRHDPCLAPRLLPVAESMVALVLAEASMRQDALVASKPTPNRVQGSSDPQAHASRLAKLRAWEDLLDAACRLRALERRNASFGGGEDQKNLLDLARERGVVPQEGSPPEGWDRLVSWVERGE